jgi:hypothetical protein
MHGRVQAFRRSVLQHFKISVELKHSTAGMPYIRVPTTGATDATYPGGPPKTMAYSAHSQKSFHLRATMYFTESMEKLSAENAATDGDCQSNAPLGF